MRSYSLSGLGLHAHLTLSRESPAAERARHLEEFRRTNNYYFGDFDSWASAMAHASGYDAAGILERAVGAARAVRSGEAAYERDTVLFSTPDVQHTLLFALLYAASRQNGRLSVLDFGGALGSAYWQNERFLQHLPELRWGVVEQRTFVEAGIREFQKDHLRFHYEVSDCVAAERSNVLLLSGVLHYLPAPYEFLESALAQRLPYVLIDRAMAHRLGRDRLCIQKVPAWIYDASYPVWLMDANKMESLFDRMEYEVIDKFEPHPGTMCGPEDFSAPYAGWFLRLRTGT